MSLVRGKKRKYKSAHIGQMKDYLKKKMSEEMMGTLVE